LTFGYDMAGSANCPGDLTAMPDIISILSKNRTRIQKCCRSKRDKDDAYSHVQFRFLA
jgi:hypothetical protein